MAAVGTQRTHSLVFNLLTNIIHTVEGERSLEQNWG